MRWKRPLPSMYVNASRVRLRRVNAAFARATEPDMLVLDAGAGRGPYRKLFTHARYEAADLAHLSTRYTALDYVCSLTDIPVEDARFDRILFNQVLEHVDNPPVVLAELHRVLKPGGQILCTCPLFFHEHQRPYDFFRYTQYGLRHLFEQAGFEVMRISWLEGYFGTVAYQFQRMYLHLPRSTRSLKPGWRGVYLAPLLWTTRFLASVLMIAYSRAELRWKYTDGGMAKNYVVLARKPSTKFSSQGVKS